MKRCLLIFGLLLFNAAIALCQGTKVTGRVYSLPDKEPLPGANVVIKGTTVGTITDMDGNYSLDVPSGDVILVFSFIGFDPLEEKINGRTSIEVSLSPNIISLSDVVVVGYGVSKKSDVTGSIASVSGKDMMKKIPTNLAQGLQGSAAGVMVAQQDGSPDGNAAIRIRGIGTITNDPNPLYVINGVQVGTSVNFLNPADIESIEILKDASATAIYGTRGANGVILITTKRGDKKETHVNFTVNYGIQTLGKTLDVQDADAYAKSIRTARAADGAVPVLAIWDAQYDGRRKTIDWQDEMTRTSIKQQYDLSVNGGTENLQSNFSVGYLKNDGIVVNSYYKRITSRASVSGKVSDFIETGGDINYMHSESMGSNNALGNNVNLSSLRDMAFITPTMDYIEPDGTYISPNVKNADGTYGVYYQTSSPNEVGKGFDNPYARQMELDNPTKINQVIANAFADIKFFEGLHFKSIGSYNFWSSDQYGWTPIRHRYNNNEEVTLSEYNGVEEFYMQANQSNNLAIENYFTYNWKTDFNNLTLMAGNSVSKGYGDWQRVYSKDFPATNIRSIGLTNVNTSKDASGAFNLESRFISYFGRLTYSLLDRYVLTATIRRDGSSNFGEGNRWGNFPSAALAWRISEEDFIKAIPVDISNLKLRLGWGRTGNAGDATDKSVDQLSSANCLYNFYNWLGSSQNFNSLNGFAQQKVIDTNLKWETNEQTNIGIDLGLFNDKITVVLDYYIRNSKDILLDMKLRPSTGFTTVYTNYGEIRNKGFDFSLGYKTNVGNDWTFGATLTGSTIKNEIIDCGNDILNTNSSTTYDGSDVGPVGGGLHWDNHSICRKGYAIGSYYGYKNAGIFTDQAELDALNAAADAAGFTQYQEAATQLGDIKYVDTNKDGHIDANDMEVLGNGIPKLNYGLNLNVGYKNFDLSLYMYGVLGQKILSYSAMKLSTMTPSDDCVSNILKDAASDSWSSTNTGGSNPRMTITDPNYNTRCSDFWIKNGNFLKLSNLQIGYTLDKNLTQNLHLGNVRIYATIQNLLTISKYNKYGDPEVGRGSVLYNGLDAGRYPMPRTYSFGLNIQF
jgi:TonB-dependent starch-binding outer membrane protein SusC